MENVGPILVAEDNEDDRLLLQTAFRRAGVEHSMVFVQDGREALDYLANAPGQHPKPCALVTDLKMPGLNGFELLAMMQGQPQYADLPVLILCSLCSDPDRKRLLEMGVREVYDKPADFHDMIELVKRMNTSWFVPHCAGRAPVE